MRRNNAAIKIIQAGTIHFLVDSSLIIYLDDGMGGPSVSIVIPAYNESKRIGRCVQDVQSFFKASGADLEVLIVVEKSSDDTANIARKNITVPFIRVIENQVHKGKGYAVRQGMLQTQGEIVFFMDADLSTPLAEVYHFLGHFKEHPETHVVI